MFKQILQEKELNFKSLEQKFYQIGCKISCDAMKELLQKLDLKLQKERDKSVYRHKGHRKTTIKTLMGEVAFSRAIYQCVNNEGDKKFVYLLDKHLNFDTIGLVSTNLAQKVVENACITSYRNTAKNVSELTGQSISHGGAWNIVQKLGQRVSDIENKQTNLYRENKLYGEKEVKVLFEEADGVILKMQGKDRKKSKTKEMRIAMFYEGWRQLGKNRYELVDKHIVCGFDKVKDFADKKEAKISSIYNVDEIGFRVFNSDGANWLKRLHYGEDTYFQLDRFHVKQAILRATKEKEIQDNITRLYESYQTEEMLDAIDAYANSIDDGKQEEKLRNLYTYLSNNKDGLIPYQKRGIDFPSPPAGIEYRNLGACEHNVDLVIAKRMKHRGASWSVNGASNLGKLLALKAAKELTKTLEHISKTVLPEEATSDIITILSSAKVSKTVGKGHEWKVCPRPNGLKFFNDIFDLKEFSELRII